MACWLLVTSNRQLSVSPPSTMPPRKEQPLDGQGESDHASKRRAVASSTVIKVLAGSKSFTITREEVDRYPGSLLHDCLGTCPASDAPLEMDLSTILSSSGLSTFEDAAAITVALYRHERLPLQLLSGAAKSHSTPELFDKLQQLLDFLNLPGPVSKHLPAITSIPLRHLAVLDLHIEAAAHHAVDLMLGSSAFTSHASTGTSGAAFYSILLQEAVRSHYELVVYALSGHRLSAWPRGSSAEVEAGCSIQAVQLPAAAGSAIGSSSSSSAGSIPVESVFKAPAVYGTKVSEQSHKVLFERINTVLSNALAQVPFNGTTGVLQSCTFQANYLTARWSGSSPVWAVWW